MGDLNLPHSVKRIINHALGAGGFTFFASKQLVSAHTEYVELIMRVENAKQSNHTSFIVPAEMGSVTYSSLHLYVAKWMLMHQRYVCCDDVEQAFGISRRQASGIIYSIHRRHADIYHCSLKRKKEGKGNVVKTWLRMDAIDVEEKKKAPVKSVVHEREKGKWRHGEFVSQPQVRQLSRAHG